MRRTAPARTFLLCATLLGVAAVPSTAEAQPARQQRSLNDAKADARTAADRGQAHFDAGSYEEAAAAFLRADRSFHAPTLVLMVARSYAKLGRLCEARAQYQRILAEQLEEYAPREFLDARAAADRELDALLPSIPTVQFSAPGVPASQVQLFIDGEPASLDVPLLRDPGHHTVIATAKGHDAANLVITLEEGKSSKIELDLPPSTSPLARDRGASSPEDTASAPAPRRFLVPTTLLLTAGGLSLGAGLVTGILAVTNADALQDSCPGGKCYDDTATRFNTTQMLATASTVTFIAGGALAAAGAGLLVWDLRRASTSSTPKDTAVLVGPAWLGVRGKF
ncbi:tetratricopeptide repeat protein [Chondromyces apiculatus]|uniref:PEGA domain-containing protein n=1 Tax=Chondromyces apiculatus DSM 436 TaxID=1192034 RepID=A0A017T9S5_9BACT|nr:hypothetical protein [Chondromyces apiculatus]EYF06023.1 Hypothetical protein CAP_2483 [Chondromyces apiculatus DSM 436]